MTIDGLRRHLEVARNLSVGHPAGGFHDDHGIQIGPLLPVGGGKRLCAEAPFTDFACKPLDTVRGRQSPKEADLLEWPRIPGIVVV